MNLLILYKIFYNKGFREVAVPLSPVSESVIFSLTLTHAACIT